MLVVGKNKSELFRHLPDRFLFLGSADITVPKRRKLVRLDPSTHSYNPLKGMDYIKARQLISIFRDLFPEGGETLTKSSGLVFILSALLSHPRSFERLIPPPGDNPGHRWAYDKVQEILLSPYLRHFLTNPTNFSFDGVIVADLDHLPDFDKFLIGNLLIANYPHTIIIPDYKAYASGFHRGFLDRMRIGVNFLDEVPKLRNDLLLMEVKLARECTASDAEILADYCSGFRRGTDGHSTFIERSIGG